MPSIEDNQSWWNRDDEWADGGDNWSADWGNVESQWQITVLPRIRPFVPTGSICEIAPGYGRWSQYLVGLCDNYVGVDLSPACVDACRERFGCLGQARFEVNDGRSLPMLEDRSVDLAFSFDSLVHVEADVIAAYLEELARVLAPDGVGWLHHSNLGEYGNVLRRLRRAQSLVGRVAGAGSALRDRSPSWPRPKRTGSDNSPRVPTTTHGQLVHRGSALRSVLRERNLIGWRHERAESMTAEHFVEMAAEVGLICVGQELLNWRGSRLIDCISLIARPTSVWSRPNEVRRNGNFAHEAASARSVSAVFTSMIGRRPTT